MNHRFFTVIGVTYVAIIAVVAAFCIFASVHVASAGEREAGRLVEETQRIDAASRRLPGSSRLPATPEYVDGKPVKYKIGRDKEGDAPKKEKEQEKAAITPTNYLVIWTADWCPYCPKMKAIGKKLEAEGFCVVFIDFDANRDEAKKLRIRSIPTSIIYTNGKETTRLIGVGKQIEKYIRASLQKDSNTAPDDYNIY